MRELVNALRSGNAILFAGAGLSVGLGAPTWNGLIRQMAEHLGYDPDILLSGNPSPWTLAEYYRLSTGAIGPLRSWMDKAWNVNDNQIRSSKAHEIISKIGFRRVYTTNYDSNIERAFELNDVPYKKYRMLKISQMRIVRALKL